MYRAVNRRYATPMIPVDYLTVVLTGILVILVSKMLDALWARMIPIRGIYLFVRAPGIVVHECSHILGCLLTGAKVKNVVLLSKEGGSVTYSPSPLPFLGDVIINTAPLFCIPLVLYGCTWIFSSVSRVQYPGAPSLRSILPIGPVAIAGRSRACSPRTSCTISTRGSLCTCT